MKSTHRILVAGAGAVLAASLVGLAAPAAWGSNSDHGKGPASKGNASSHSHGNAGTKGPYNKPQPYSHADLGGHGANPGSPSNPNPYRSTRSGAPSLNGNGQGQAVGKPCAGCVGRADNKNPKGQQPGGSDPNNGYECDGNHGIGRTNPAHTGCAPAVPSSTTTTTTTTPPAATTTTTVPAPPAKGSSGGPTNSGAPPPVAHPQPPAAITASPPGALAFTGSATSSLALLGLMALGAGTVLTVVARRRQAAHAEARPEGND